jgi:hypothetical protein
MNSSTLMQKQIPIRSRLVASAASATSFSSSPSNQGNRISVNYIEAIHLSRNEKIFEQKRQPANVSPLDRLQSSTQSFMMHITIDANFVTDLRHLLISTCGELVAFIRIQPIAHATRMKVWLCLTKPAAEMVMAAIMSVLPSAEFGQITPA